MLIFQNERPGNLTVVIDPWGGDFTLAPGEGIRVVPLPDDRACWFRITDFPDHISISIEGKVDFYEVFHVATDEMLPTGYGRERASN